MLTDDDLTRALSDAFRDETDHLGYTGRRRPPLGAVATAVPAAAALAGIAVLTTVAVNSGPAARPQADRTPPASPTTTSLSGTSSSGAGSAPVPETRTFALAGRTFRYRAAPGTPDPVKLFDRATLPADAEPIPASPDRLGRAWLGTDPASGDNALYVKVETRNGGRLFALVSPVWTKQQLREFLLTGTVSR